MNFDLAEEQRDLASAAADWFSAHASPASARTALEDPGSLEHLAPGRAAVVASGFATITVPEEHGGGGGSVLDLAVAAEQAGRVLAAPSLVTFARAAVLLEGDETRLRALADGSASYAVIDERAPTLDAAGADTFLSRRGDALVCGPGTVTPGEPIDPTRGLGRVEPTGEADVVLDDAGPRWERAAQVARVVLAAEGLGAASRALELGVAYAKERQAFGRAIGSYQAVKHALVDSYVQVEQLRSLVWWSAWAADQQPGELPLAAAAAKGAAAVALEQAAETLIQVHGGIGFTWEHDAHLYWRRAKVDRFLLGDDIAAFDEVARLALSEHADTDHANTMEGAAR